MKFLLPILFLLYIPLLLPTTVNNLLKKLHIVKNYIDVYILCTVNICLQPIILSQGKFFLMIGSLEVTHELLFTIPSVIQISSINWIWLNLVKTWILFTHMNVLFAIHLAVINNWFYLSYLLKLYITFRPLTKILKKVKVIWYRSWGLHSISRWQISLIYVDDSIRMFR